MSLSGFIDDDCIKLKFLEKYSLGCFACCYYDWYFSKNLFNYPIFYCHEMFEFILFKIADSALEISQKSPLVCISKFWIFFFFLRLSILFLLFVRFHFRLILFWLNLAFSADGLKIAKQRLHLFFLVRRIIERTFNLFKVLRYLSEEGKIFFLWMRLIHCILAIIQNSS